MLIFIIVYKVIPSSTPLSEHFNETNNGERVDRIPLQTDAVFIQGANSITWLLNRAIHYSLSQL